MTKSPRTVKNGSALTKHQRYYRKHRELLRVKARERMAQRRRNSKIMRDSHTPDPFASCIPLVMESDSASDGFESVCSGWGSIEDEPRTDLRCDFDATHPQFATHALEDDLNRLSLSQFDCFAEAERLADEWLAEWGGLDCWNRHLDRGYLEAKVSDCVDAWVKGVIEHADRGRILADMVGQMEVNIPREMWKIRELWRRQTLLVRRVCKALALIEVHVDIICSGPFNVVGT